MLLIAQLFVLQTLAHWLLRRKFGWSDARISASMSLAHAISTTALSLASMHRYIFSPSEIGAAPTEALLLDDDPLSAFTLCADVGSAYMLHDMFLLVRGALGMGYAYPQWPTALLHHAVVAGALAVSKHYAFARPVVLLTFTEEASTVLLNLAQVLQMRHDTALYRRLRAAFFVVFMLSRFSFMWAVVANLGRFRRDLMQTPHWDLYSAPFFALSVMLLGLRGLNLYWLALIVRKVSQGRRA